MLILKQEKKGGEFWLPPGATFPLWIPNDSFYDGELVEKYIRFCRTYFIFPHGPKSNQPIVWDDFQIDYLVRPILGLFETETEHRTITVCFYCSGRGSSKTTKASSLAIFFCACMGEMNPEVNLFAESRKQAQRMYGTCEKLINSHQKTDPHGEKLHNIFHVKDSEKTIYYPPNGGEIVVRSGDADAEQGLNATAVFVDEVSSQRNRDLWDTARTGLGKRATPGLLMGMTTPSLKIKPSLFARKEYNKAISISKKRSLVRNYLPVIFALDKTDNVFDEKLWPKANPGLKSGFPNLRTLREEAADAKLDPTALHSWKVYRCGIWQDKGHTFITEDVWDSNIGQPPHVEVLKSLPCFFGLDVSGSIDMTSLCMLWWDSVSQNYFASWRYWITEKSYESINRESIDQLKMWAKDDSVDLTIQKSRFIDLKKVCEKVMQDYAFFKPFQIGIDTYRSREVYQNLKEEHGLPVELLSQEATQMSPSVLRVIKSSVNQQLVHNGDPLTKWCILNTDVEYNKKGLPRIIKSLDELDVRIDGTSSLTMAMDRHLFQEREKKPKKEKAKVHLLWELD